MEEFTDEGFLFIGKYRVMTLTKVFDHIRGIELSFCSEK